MDQRGSQQLFVDLHRLTNHEKRAETLLCILDKKRICTGSPLKTP